jgi:hypothetical protein
MSISTTEKPEDKREKLKKLREFHQPIFNELKIPDALFYPKMAYRPYGKTEVHISFFLSEINRGEDLYVEFTSKELVPEDPKRALYKWKFNPHFEEEYEKTEPNATTGHCRYLVPVEELILVTKEPVKFTQEKMDFSGIPDPNEDLPMDQMTIRDYAAIHLKKPVSKKEWLNTLINNINHG